MDGETETIKEGIHEDALSYELDDMEKAIQGDLSVVHADYYSNHSELKLLDGYFIYK